MPVWSLPLGSEEKTVAVLGDSGIVLGFEDVHGCRWFWDGNDPWSPSPGVRAVVGERATGHGEWDATRYYGARSPQFRGTVVAPDHATLHAAKQRLFNAVTVELFKLRVIEPGFDRYAMARRDGEVLWTEMRSKRSATYSLSLKAPDPVVYSETVHTSTDGIQTTRTITNNGGVSAYPVFTLTGPMSRSVSLVNTTTGQSTILLGDSINPVVADGETLTVDMRRRLIYDHTGTRRRNMHGEWWGLKPGENVLTLDGLYGEGSGDSESAISLTWQEGWI